MKNICFAFVLFFGLWSSCTELPPNLGGGNNPDPNENKIFKNVLIEKFTGVKCKACPAGSRAIEAIKDIHGDRVVSVSVHTGFFAVPYPESEFDFRTQDSDDLLNFISGVSTFPSASLNRIIFEGENVRPVGKEKWAGFSELELAEEAAIDLTLDLVYNTNSRKLEVNLDGEFLSNVDLVSPRFSVYLVENNIVDYQLDGEILVPDYNHKHVLRKALTAIDGDVLNVETTRGTLFSEQLSFTLPQEWNESEVNVIAFVNDGGGNQEILQVLEKEILE